MSDKDAFVTGEAASAPPSGGSADDRSAGDAAPRRSVTGPLLEMGAALLVVFGLQLSRSYSYLLFHSLIEILSIGISLTIFFLAWNTRRYLKNGYLEFIGIGYGSIAVIDLLHTLAYKGLNVFPGYGADLPTQLWIAARYLQAGTLLAAIGFRRKRPRQELILAGYALAVFLFVAAIFTGRFPQCFSETSGLTPFKIYSEYVIVALLLAALWLISRRESPLAPTVRSLVVLSIVFTAASELSFTQYVSVYGPANAIGHYLKLGAFFLLYRAILVTGIREPFSMIFRELKETEATLRQTNEQLKAANRELEAFTCYVTHDLRTPLRAIGGFSHLLEIKHGGTLAPPARELLQRIREGVGRMERLIQDLLDLSLSTLGGLRPGAIGMTELARGVIEELTAAMPAERVVVTLRELPSCHGDANLLRLVWVNLIGNALKYSGKREPAEIEIGGLEGTAENIYFVRDNGAGFDMSYVDQLFVAFKRLHGAKEFEGTGIGLAIVERIVLRHEGRVWAQGAPGAGATFWFAIPRRPDAAVSG